MEEQERITSEDGNPNEGKIYQISLKFVSPPKGRSTIYSELSSYLQIVLKSRVGIFDLTGGEYPIEEGGLERGKVSMAKGFIEVSLFLGEVISQL